MTEPILTIGVLTLGFTVISAIVGWIWRVASAAHAENSKTRDELNKFQVEVAREYATNNALQGVEARMTAAISRLSDELSRSIAGMSSDFKALITQLIQK